MKLFVFENVLIDWTGGMVVISADSLEQALELARKDHGETVDLEPGWQKPRVYSLSSTELVDAKVQHCCYGGA